MKTDNFGSIQLSTEAGIGRDSTPEWLFPHYISTSYHGMVSPKNFSKLRLLISNYLSKVRVMFGNVA